MLRLFGNLIVALLSLAMIGMIVGIVLFYHFSKDLPDYSQLATYDPPVATRLYAADGRLMAEYATEKRVFVPLTAIPKRVRLAFLSAEDRNFFEHSGIDPVGIGRAIVTNLSHHGQSLAGGSTITQQVVKNFLLTNEKSFTRKVKEAILSFRLTQAYSKERILELYLNEIYLGAGSYGVAAAALNYFNKSLDDLTVEEAAMLAALPKAPATYDPRRFPQRGKERRDWVIGRMLEDGVINADEAKMAQATPITLRTRDATQVVEAPYFAEEVRRELARMYGTEKVYEAGLTVHTTMDPAFQQLALRSLRNGLKRYDRKHGYRGPVGHVPNLDDLSSQLAGLKLPALPAPMRYAVVTDVSKTGAAVMVSGTVKGEMAFDTMKWARPAGKNGGVGAAPGDAKQVVKIGDVVVVEPFVPESPKEDKKDPKAEKPKDEAAKEAPAKEKEAKEPAAPDYSKVALSQVPMVGGGLVAIDPHTGRVLAMAGGFSTGDNEFNRVTQAKRQPGSAFKPFVYLTAMENGYNPSSIVLDAPVELYQGAGLPMWRPKNYKDDYLGPTTLRRGLEKSRNTMTVRLGQSLGIDRVIEVARRFGIYDQLPRNFSIVLGSHETTLLRLANAYAMLVNGGKRSSPAIIERITDRNGKTVFRRDTRTCDACRVAEGDVATQVNPPIIPDNRPQITDPRTAYQMVSIMQGVVEHGTGADAKKLGKILGGKTGTTNDSYDTWFIGFSPDLVVGAYVGYDRPRTLGPKETGASLALPIFEEFMAEALKDVPSKPFRVPPGIMLTKVDHASGQATYGTGPNIILEAFIAPDSGPLVIPRLTDPKDKKEAQEPQAEQQTAPVAPPTGIDRFEQPSPTVPPPPRKRESMPDVGTGGLY